MLYFLGALIIVSIIVVLIFIRTSKDTKRRISYRDRAKLEASLDFEATETKEAFAPAANSIKQQIPPAPQLKIELPKDFKTEIMRFKNFVDPEEEQFNTSFKSAITKLASGDYRNALDDFNEAIGLKPFGFQAFYCRGLLNCMMNNFKEAVNDFTETIRLEPDEKNALYFRGIARYNSKDLISADQDLSSFLIAVPQFPETYFYLGLIYSKQDRYEEASANFSKVIKLSPNHAKAYFERGLVKLKEGNREGCCKDLRTSMTLGNLEAYHHIKENCEHKADQPHDQLSNQIGDQPAD